MGIFDKAREKLFNKIDGVETPLEHVGDQSKEEQDLCAYSKNRLEDFRMNSSRIANEGIWLTNIAYLCGFDSIYFDTNGKQFKPIQYPSPYVRKNKVHVNRILPTVQNRLARLLKSPPRYDVKPKSSDEDDKDAARLAKQVLEQSWEFLGINKKRIPMMMWVQQCGHAFMKISWDDSLGETKVYPGEGEDLVAEKTGDIRVDVCSPFEIFVDPLAKTMDDVEELIQAKIRKLQYFKDTYERGYLVKEEGCWLQSLQYEARINTFNQSTGAAGSSSFFMRDAAIEINHYIKPNKKYPFGRHIISANGVLLKDGVLPIDEFPFVKFDDIVVAGKFTSESVITHLRSLQDYYNKNKSLRVAWTNRLLNGKYIAARGHGIAAEAFNDESGEIIEYDPVPNASEPHSMQIPSIPQYSYREDETTLMDMNDTAGINEASRGQMPSASIPAIGMQLLIEQDDTRIGIETESHEYSWADLGRKILKFVGEYYSEPRLLKISGRNMQYTVKKFKGADLKNNFDVTVIRGSTLPGSKVLKRQEILNLYERGLLGPAQDPKTIDAVMSMLEYGDVHDAWKRHALIMQQIERGIKTIEEKSEMPIVSEFDAHDLWIQQLDLYRLSDKFLKLDDVRKQLVLDTMQQHLSYLQNMVDPSSMDEPDLDPGLQEETAAQEMEQKILAEEGV